MMKVTIIILTIITVIFFGIACGCKVKAHKNADTDMLQRGNKFSAGFSLFALVDIICIVIFLLI